MYSYRILVVKFLIKKKTIESSCIREIIWAKIEKRLSPLSNTIDYVSVDSYFHQNLSLCQPMLP